MKIAVVGATGNTGRAVVKELKGLGESPVCVVRNADKAKEVEGGSTALKASAALIAAGGLAGMTSVLLITFLSQARSFCRA